MLSHREVAGLGSCSCGQRCVLSLRGHVWARGFTLGWKKTVGDITVMNLPWHSQNHKYLWSHVNIWILSAWLESSDSPYGFLWLWIEFKPQCPVSLAYHPSVRWHPSRASFKGRVQPCSVSHGRWWEEGVCGEVPGVQGARMQIHIQQIGPGMVQQIQTYASSARARGGASTPRTVRKLLDCQGRREKRLSSACGEGEAARTSTQAGKCPSGAEYGARRLGIPGRGATAQLVFRYP